ncbi:MAG: LPXTG cell wall anchor domain-containing protein [Polymorphobacter sp.]
MITIDSSILTALAALVTSLSGLVWAFRRKR